MATYARDASGKFSGAAGSTKKSARAATRNKTKNSLKGKSGRSKVSKTSLAKKARGQRVVTKVAQRASDRARKRFG